MTVGELFAGIGGLGLGLERAGMEVRWQVEIDPFCTKVLENHWPDVNRYEDVRDVGAHNLEPVDLICGGFPCVTLSRAGRRTGTDDDKWIWPQFERVIRELRPRYVLVENVPGLLVHAAGDVLGDLAALGYDTEWDCFTAKAFGALHIRDRVFLLAYDGGGRHGPPEETVFAGRFGSELRVRWPSEPDVARVVHGLSGAVDRRRALGNAAVPQVAEYIGRRILKEQR